MVQHREIQAVDPGNITQLPTRGITLACALDLDDIGAKPGQQLSTGRP